MPNDRRPLRRGALGALALLVGGLLRSAPLRAQTAPSVARAHAGRPARTAAATRRAAPGRQGGTTLDGAQAPNAFAPGDSVDVEYERRGEWIPAQVTEVLNDGYAYAVNLAPHDDATMINAQIHWSRVRAHVAPAAGASSGDGTAPAPEVSLPEPSSIPPAPAPPPAPPLPHERRALR